MVCPICLEEKGEYITLKCNHKFHKSCIRMLINYDNKCPMCRKKIFNDTICDCPIYSPYLNLGECRFCFGISKRLFIKKYYNILKN